MLSKTPRTLVLALMLVSAVSTWGQSREEFGDALGNNLIVSYVTGYQLVHTIGDAYFKGYPKTDALEKCEFATQLLEGSRAYFAQMIQAYRQAGMMSDADRTNSLEYITVYDKLIEAAGYLSRFIASDGSSAEAFNQYSNIMAAIYRGLEGDQ